MGVTVGNRLRLFWRDSRAVSAIEFAMIAPIVVMLMLGAYDFGNAAQQQIALQEAVRTGGQYAAHFPTNPVLIQQAVTNALPSGAGWRLIANPGDVPVVTCSCSGATGTFDCSAPPSTCLPPMLVRITATMPYTTLTPMFAALIPNNITATYVSRFQ